MSRTAQRCAVIGAGAAGLSATRHLLEHGHEVVVFEAGSYVGGLWVHENDNGRGVAYDSLHINSEPAVTAYRGHPFPPGTPFFPSHHDVRRYLVDFAEQVGVTERIRFNTPVVAVEPAEPTGGQAGQGWTVRTGDGNAERFDVVVVGSGHQACAAHPGWATRFTGDYRHSADYRRPEPFSGRRVLVVGVGNSGLDIAADLVPFAAETHTAARSPVLIMPRMILGMPSFRVLSTIGKPWLPWWVQRRLLYWISRLYHGRPEQWGFRTPTTRTHPASNATYMAHVSYGRVGVHPGVADVRGTTVAFDDGSEIDVDAVIAATGYEIDLPFLRADLDPVVDRRVEAWQRVVHPAWPGLYFVGFFNVSGGANIAMMDVQSELVAGLVDGTTRRPSARAMRRDIAREHRRTRRRFPAADRYGLELEPGRYRKQVAAALARGGRP